MKEKLTSVFDVLQLLDMKPTPHNVSIMNGVYSVLREIYGELTKKGETENAESENGTAADPDGRHAD